MRKTNTKVNNSFEFKVTTIYKTARKQQKTAQRKTFYVDEFEVSPSEWATAKMNGYDTAVSNASVKGNIPRLVRKRDVVTLDEILEIVPELV